MSQMIQMGWGELSPERETLSAWLRLYMDLEGGAGSVNTTVAKESDLASFLRFLECRGVKDLPDQWTPVVTGAFLTRLKGERKSPATINRVLSTLRRAATWIGQQRPFLAGHPCGRLRDVKCEEPEWKGLTDEELARLRLAVRTRLRQGGGLALRDGALFLVLLHTGLRISELLSVDLCQWEGSHLHNVRRKGNLVTRQVFLASEALALLGRYVDEERGLEGQPLFCSRSGRRLLRQNANEALKRLADLASGSGSPIMLSAHVLRHTMLRHTADKHGVAYAKEVSGHVSDRYIWRYVKPSREAQESALEALYD